MGSNAESEREATLLVLTPRRAKRKCCVESLVLYRWLQELMSAVGYK